MLQTNIAEPCDLNKCYEHVLKAHGRKFKAKASGQKHMSEAYYIHT